jgi:predicted DNA-binding transcriptional regulator AlpA
VETQQTHPKYCGECCEAPQIRGFVRKSRGVVRRQQQGTTMTVLLRFPDLKRYGVNNHPTLKRWIQREGFPSGFYLASNTRAWHEQEVEEWLANRPKADPPPPEIAKPGPRVDAQGTGLKAAKAGRQSNSPDNRIGSLPQASCKNGGA